ncbi:MAG: hypothetical protein ACXV5P_02170 [Halobacteriota archaeon]
MKHVSNEMTELARDPPFRNKIRHPPCITFLLRYGIPNDMNDERALSIIARYGAAKGLDEKQGERMARTMMCSTPSLSVGKAKKNFWRGEQFHLAKRENRGAKIWSCAEVLSSKRLRERGMCTGWHCEYYSPRKGAERRPQSSTDETHVEQALLTYVLNNPKSVTEGLQVKLQSESFVGTYTCRDGVSLLLNRALWHACCYLARQNKEIRTSAVLHLLSRHSGMQPYLNEITRYVRDVSTRPPCRHDVFLEYLLQVRERGMEQHIQALIYAASSALRSHTLPLDIILHTLEEQAHSLSFTIDDVISKLDDDLAKLIETFVSEEHRAIPTSSSWLNNALGGGWKQGRVYAVYASCGIGATDFAAWCTDHAAWCSHPTLYVSCGKSRDDMGLEALARHSGVETNDLSTQKGRIYDSAEGEAMLERLISGGERLSKRIAQHIWTLEADDQTTTADIMRAARAVQHHGGPGHGKPVLLLIDHLSATAPSEKRVASGNDRRGPSEGHTTLESLKRSVGNSKAAVIVVFIAHTTRNEGRPRESMTDPAASLEHLKKRSAADYALTLHPYNVEIEGLNGKKIVDQLDIAREWYACRYPKCREYIQRCFDELRDDCLAEATRRYARVSLCKKGGSALSNPLILYERSLHRFEPSDIQPTNFEEKIRTFPETYDDGTL